MSEKKWIITPAPPAEFIETHPELPSIVARLLWSRNLTTQAQIDEFLNPDYSVNVHDPFLFNDMRRAVEIIFDCIKANKKIVVHGDYDADGVDAAVIIINTLKKLGAKNVDVFLPHRETDGYGLNNNTVNLLYKNGANLIITCDCGISNTEEITLAKKLGLQVIITDHHAIPAKLPPADAILHPLIKGEAYPDKTLAGGGVAFKLAQGLLKQHKILFCHSELAPMYVGAGEESPDSQPGDPSPPRQVRMTNCFLPNNETHEQAEKWLLDMVAIATVADMVPLLGESRTLTRYGLMVLNKTRNWGLKKLMELAGLIDENGQAKRGSLNAHNIGFQIAPRLNAAGRMDHANVAFALLTAPNEAEAEVLAKQLNQNNTDRQKLTEKLALAGRFQVVEEKQETNAVIFAYGEDWPTGILGLVASRVREEFFRPTIIMGLANGLIVGSGRSIPGFNLIAALQSMPHFFYKFGGHPQACGFSLKSTDLLPKFKKTLIALAAEQTKNLDLTPQINIAAEVDLEDVDWKLYDVLQKFEPFGAANEEPLYAARGLTVVSVEPVGLDGKHLRLLVKHNSHIVRKTIAFGFGDIERHPANWKVLKPGDKIDLAFTIGVNEWNGNRELQLQVEDIKKTK